MAAPLPQGRANVPKCAIITALNGLQTPDLLTFATVLRQLPHGARAPLEYLTFSERHRRKNAILHVDRQWCVLGIGVSTAALRKQCLAYSACSLGQPPVCTVHLAQEPVLARMT